MNTFATTSGLTCSSSSTSTYLRAAAPAPSRSALPRQATQLCGPHVSCNTPPMSALSSSCAVAQLCSISEQVRRPGNVHGARLLPPPPRHNHIAASASTKRLSGQGFKEDLETISPQPAMRATLRMLEWNRICEHLAAFASTAAGKQACLNLGVPRTEEGSQLLLRQTRYGALPCFAQA